MIPSMHHGVKQEILLLKFLIDGEIFDFWDLNIMQSIWFHNRWISSLFTIIDTILELSSIRNTEIFLVI